MDRMLYAFRSFASIIVYAGLLLPSSAADGVFCKGSLVFAEKTEASGNMSFGVAGTDGRQHIFSEQGKAKPYGHGWRYQVLSKDNPDERCTIDITPVGEGFRLKTHEGATCISSGGYGANELISDVTFPGSSRVRDIEHELDSGSQILNVTCSPKSKRQ